MSKRVSRAWPLIATAQADDHVAQRAIVQVDHARPGDRHRVDLELVAVGDLRCR